jgi:hypothetical protein
MDPSDPVIGWLRPGDFATYAGMQRLLNLAQQHQPELLHQTLASHHVKAEWINAMLHAGQRDGIETDHEQSNASRRLSAKR